jgi:class 3 adenylate cyclase
MATLREQLTQDVTTILSEVWDKRDGEKVPEADDLKLNNDAVLLDATVLYADLAQSTDLVARYKDFFAAEVYKTYLMAASRIIRAHGGEITSFDGDRVMGVFVGSAKNSNAAKTALKINWAVKKLINPAIKKHYPNTSYLVSQVVGIDTSRLFVARTGIRGSNDLVWVGPAANNAAKLCSLRDGGHSSYMTESVFKLLNDDSKYGGSEPKQTMWTKFLWAETGSVAYGSSWWWEL